MDLAMNRAPGSISPHKRPFATSFLPVALILKVYATKTKINQNWLQAVLHISCIWSKLSWFAGLCAVLGLDL